MTTAVEAAADAVADVSSIPSTRDADLRLLAPPYRSLVVGVVGVVVAVAFEAIAVATAMPVAARELGGVGKYGLLFSVFLTTSLLGMVVAGELSDRRGPVRPFVAAALAFAVGLLLAGLAPSMWVLVLARAVQGLGAGLNIVSLYVVVGRAFPAALRPRVFSAFSSGWILPSLVGPPVAGLLADNLSWRWVFLGILPLLLGAAALIGPHLRGLDEAGSDDATAEPPPARRGRVPAAFLAAGGAGLLQYAGQQVAGGMVVALASAAAAAVLLALGVPRLLPAGTFRAARGLPTVVLLRGLLAGAFFGAETFLPLMLVEHRGLATTWAGASLTGAALTWSLGSWLQGRPGLGVPRRRLLVAGFLLVLLGIGLAALATSATVPAATAAAGWVAAGLGMGLAMTSLSVLVLELSPPGQQGRSSSALQVSDGLGSIALLAMGGAVVAAAGAGAAHDARPYLVIDAVMALVAVLGAVVAPRVRPDTR